MTPEALLKRMRELAGDDPAVLAMLDTHAATLRPMAARMLATPRAPTYFASGSNHPGEIRGFRERGQHVGVAAPECKGACERELALYRGTGLQVFVDSGAFSEVTLNALNTNKRRTSGKKKGTLPRPDLPEDATWWTFPDKPPWTFVVTKPMTEADWNRALSLYERLAALLGPQLHVVAPDQVGDQEETLRRLARYRDRIHGIQRMGARVIVPLQGGKMSLDAFDDRVQEVLGGADYTVGFPSKKAATSTEAIASFLSRRQPARVHLLGLGPKSDRHAEVLAAIRSTSPNTAIYLDSVLIRAHVGRQESVKRRPGDPAHGIQPGGRAFTRAADLVAEQMAAHEKWGETDVEVSREGDIGGFSYDEAMLDLTGWLSKTQLRKIAEEAGLTDAQRTRFVRDPDSFLQAESPHGDPWYMHPDVERALDAAWGRYWKRGTVAEKKRRALVEAYPEMIKVNPLMQDIVRSNPELTPAGRACAACKQGHRETQTFCQ
jgi:hypothetical protein